MNENGNGRARGLARRDEHAGGAPSASSGRPLRPYGLRAGAGAVAALLLAISLASCQRLRAPAPEVATPAWQRFIGVYESPDRDTLVVRERDGQLEALRRERTPREATAARKWEGWGPVADSSARIMRMAEAAMEAGGRVLEVRIGGRGYRRLSLGPEDGSTFRIVPQRPVEELRRAARAATPPRETAKAAPDLVEIVALDSTIHLDIRYATTNNFMGAAFYAEPRAFLQREAAEALVRANRTLRGRGYGILVHDAYRPWYVTKMFWDATPEAQRDFVADPARGSRHNRGAAVDVTLYDLVTGRAVEMPTGYDEFSERALPDYPGGTTRQRALRQLLREAMEAEGFDVYAFEWWHFDYGGWDRWPILNVDFERIPQRSGR